jgi:hypothetical protein
MGGFDFFHLFRFMLAIFATAYTLIGIGQFAWQWRRDSAAAGRGEALMRRYLIVQFLRIKTRRFLWDLLEIAALLAVLFYLVGRH